MKFICIVSNVIIGKDVGPTFMDLWTVQSDNEKPEPDNITYFHRTQNNLSEIWFLMYVPTWEKQWYKLLHAANKAGWSRNTWGGDINLGDLGKMK